MKERILVARIGAPHGVKGEVRFFPFTEDPMAVLDYQPLTDKEGHRKVRLLSLRPAKDHFVARLDGIDDRTAAEALTQMELYAPRECLPPEEDEDTFYHADLMGLRVEAEDGARLGTVSALHDFGAGDILEYVPAEGGKSLMVPFTKAAVPVVDIKGGRVVIATDFIERGDQTPEDEEAAGETPLKED